MRKAKNQVFRKVVVVGIISVFLLSILGSSYVVRERTDRNSGGKIVNTCPEVCAMYNRTYYEVLNGHAQISGGLDCICINENTRLREHYVLKDAVVYDYSRTKTVNPDLDKGGLTSIVKKIISVAREK